MKKQKFMKINTVLLAFVLMATFALNSCKEDEPAPPADGDVTAVFSSTAVGNEVTFVDASVNATAWSWDFGDGTGTSTDQNPVYTYAAPGSYDVTLTASNATKSGEVTNNVVTQNGGALASKIVNKEWIPAHGEAWAYAQGGADADHGDTWDDQRPVDFGWGDIPGGWANLKDRPGLANDVYVFNGDGSMSVDFNGDFWLEYSMWDSEGSHDLASPLPNGVGGDDMTAFANPDDNWSFDIDEVNSKIITTGSGSHILNPRLAYGGPSDGMVLVPQSSVNYDIIRVVEVAGAADTLVIYASADGVSHYITLHSYESTNDIPEWYYPCVIARSGSVAASDYAHTFGAEDGSTAMATINVDYVPTWGVTDPSGDGGANCTKFEIFNPAGHNVWGNLLMRGGTPGTCDAGTETYVDAITFANSEYHVKFDIYIPAAENDFNTALVNTLWVRWGDESQLGGNFWQNYVQIAQDDIATDSWVSVDFDFNGADMDGKVLADLIADESMVPDFVQIDWGGDNHGENGAFYIRNFRLEQ